MNDISNDKSDPALSNRSENAFHSIEARKTCQSIPTPELASGKGKSQRGANWDDDDSILLVQAVAYIQEHPIGISYQHAFLIVVGENKVAMHQ